MFAPKQKSGFAALASNAARVRKALLTAILSAVLTSILFKPLGPAAPLFVFFMVLAAHAGPLKSAKSKLTKNFWGITETPPADANEAKTFHARAQLQVALDRAAQAESAAGRASYGDKMSRMAAAEQAGYNAIAAREAASRASASAQGGPIEANDAAAQAYQAACRAQAAADRARYSAAGAK